MYIITIFTGRHFKLLYKIFFSHYLHFKSLVLSPLIDNFIEFRMMGVNHYNTKTIQLLQISKNKSIVLDTRNYYVT